MTNKLMWHQVPSNEELIKRVKEEINNQRKNVKKGVSHSDTLWTKTATSDTDALSLTAIDGHRNPQESSGRANVAKKEDTSDGTLPADSKSKVVILDDNVLSLSCYAEEYPENFKSITETKK